MVWIGEVPIIGLWKQSPNICTFSMFTEVLVEPLIKIIAQKILGVKAYVVT